MHELILIFLLISGSISYYFVNFKLLHSKILLLKQVNTSCIFYDYFEKEQFLELRWDHFPFNCGFRALGKSIIWLLTTKPFLLYGYKKASLTAPCYLNSPPPFC